MAELQSEHPNELSVGVDLGRGRAEFLARNLSDANLRWVIPGLGGGTLGVWLLKEVGEFVLSRAELQLRYGG